MVSQRVIKKAPAKRAPAKKQNLDAMHTSVRRIMTRRVKTVLPGMSLEAAIDLMMDQEIGHLPVVDEEGALVGILSKTDLVRERLLDGDTGTTEVQISGRHGVRYSPGPGFHEEVEVRKTVADLMSKRVKTVNADATVAEAALAMSKLRVHGLPVVEDGKTLVGILSTFDIVDWVASI